MASENKTKPTKVSVTQFINSVENDTRRADAKKLLKLFKDITGEKAVMWGPSIIGFGKYHYQYESGREGDMMMTGFSPRKSNLVIYCMDGFDDKTNTVDKLGKCKTSRACLYINKLADVDEKVLARIIKKSYTLSQKRKVKSQKETK